MSVINFDSEEVQRKTWNAARRVILNGLVEAMYDAQKAVPTDDSNEIAIRDGLILDQIHAVLCDAIGEIEGQLLRHSMRTDESLTTQRQEQIDAGRVRGAGVTKQ